MVRKHKAVKRVKRGEDRISGLPDEVLGQILSYLTTAESVSTSILSKRWSSVWSYVPFLDLSDVLLCFDDPNEEHAVVSSFIQFLNNVFNLHKTDSLQKLTLNCHKFDSHRINEWVLSAIRCKLKELDLCTRSCEDLELCTPLFVHQDLVSLKLGGKFVIDIPGEVHLPSVKKLHLDGIKFLDESCHKLLSGCPVLEHLHIKDSGVLGKVETLQIIAPALKFLLLHYLSDVGSVVVDAPCLEVLGLHGRLAKRYSFKNLNSLTDASIDVNIDFHYPVSRNDSEVRETSRQLVNGIANAKIITFTGRTLKVLSFLDLTALPMFNDLTKLELGGHSFCAKLLPKFLANSPFLQDLVLDLVCVYRGSWDFEWQDPIQVPQCLLDCLKSVKILGFTGKSTVPKFMKYLLSNGKVLVELSAGCKEKEHKELKTSQGMLSLLLEK